MPIHKINDQRIHYEDTGGNSGPPIEGRPRLQPHSPELVNRAVQRFMEDLPIRRPRLL